MWVVAAGLAGAGAGYVYGRTGRFTPLVGALFALAALAVVMTLLFENDIGPRPSEYSKGK
jgi:membrane associated rhomboid family serine protease